MEDDALIRAQADLVAWGVLESAPELRPTRRFRAAIARAASELQAQERTGARLIGHPMERAVSHAFTIFPLPSDVPLRREHRMLVVALELASYPDEVRALIGHPG